MPGFSLAASSWLSLCLLLCSGRCPGSKGIGRGSRDLGKQSVPGCPCLLPRPGLAEVGASSACCGGALRARWVGPSAALGQIGARASLARRAVQCRRHVAGSVLGDVAMAPQRLAHLLELHVGLRELAAEGLEEGEEMHAAAAMSSLRFS